MTDARVLLLPGWLDSGPGHWQSHWERLYGWLRVQQHDWVWPRRGDWMAQLETTLLASSQPAVLVAHSLGCHLVAAWSAHSTHTERVRGALLVAPPDLDAVGLPPQLANWRPARRQRLPFATRLLYSSNDAFCSTACAEGLAADWGATARCIGERGHVNAESGLGDWPEGAAEVHELIGPSR